MDIHANILAWRILWTEEPIALTGYNPLGCKEPDMTEHACTHAYCLLHPLASLYLSTRNTGNLEVFKSFQYPVHFHSHHFPRSQMSLETKQ